MNPKRIRQLNQIKEQNSNAVLYWMDRERRSQDNWALIAAYGHAKRNKVPLHVLYAIPAAFYEAGSRSYQFMLKGLQETAQTLFDLNIHFTLKVEDPVQTVLQCVKQNKISAVYTDLASLRLPRSWRTQLAKSLDVPFFEVDARSVVPVFETSNKKEYSARTIRPKLHSKLAEFLDEFPKLSPFKYNTGVEACKVDIAFILKKLGLDSRPIDLHFQPGVKAAKKMLSSFIKDHLSIYDKGRSDPNAQALSNLSPYLHFGQISAQRVLLNLVSLPESDNKNSFIEELFVRRELAENFCFYEPNYDNFSGLHVWAQTTLNQHRNDPREFLYSQQEFEESNTHDFLWNAAQNQMKLEGKMHGFMRMYWGKKILEWSKGPEEALKIANYLNNKYELDGRDPSGYTGVAWSIGGVHDRAWFERPIFGKVRYMNFNGCKRKFNVEAYIEKYSN